MNCTRSVSERRYPAWSPDGNRIAFESDRDGTWRIFVMDADGTNVVTTNQKGMNPA